MGAIDRRKRVAHDRRGYAERGYYQRFLPFQFFDHTGASPLEKYSQQILDLIGEQRDLTLNELVSILRKRRISASRSALSRFFARHGITFKKKPAGGGAQAR